MAIKKEEQKKLDIQKKMKELQKELDDLEDPGNVKWKIRYCRIQKGDGNTISSDLS